MKTNTEILIELAKYLTENPDIRFGQALWNLDILFWRDKMSGKIHDPHADSDEEILKRIKDVTQKRTED